MGGHQVTQLTPTICNDDWTRLEFLSVFFSPMKLGEIFSGLPAISAESLPAPRNVRCLRLLGWPKREVFRLGYRRGG